MNKQQHRAQQAEQLIKYYAFGSSLTGFIPIPLLDTVGGYSSNILNKVGRKKTLTRIKPKARLLPN